MSIENSLWGAPRIHGELLKLGFKVAQSSVAKYMVKRRGPPSQGWQTFQRDHAPDIAAMDLFVVPTIGFKFSLPPRRGSADWENADRGSNRLAHGAATNALLDKVIAKFPDVDFDRREPTMNSRDLALLAENDMRRRGCRRSNGAPGSRCCSATPRSRNGYGSGSLGAARRDSEDRL
jgi:hypothetical protein